MTPEQPTWTELAAKNLGTKRGDVLGIVLHDTAGTGTHNDTLYLANPTDGREVSVDFTVERNGSIWKLNPQLRINYTFHAGRATSFKGFVNADVNLVTIGIEIVQKRDLSLSPIYPKAQVAAVGQLCAWLTSSFGLQSSDITTHRQIVTDGSRSDPRRFPFDTPDGFWSNYWKAYGMQQNFLNSLTASDF